MKDEVSIKIKIADRVFPIKVSTQEEYYVRKAVKNLDQKIKTYRSRYGINEYKDVLAMISLELATEQAKLKDKEWLEDDGITDKIDEIDEKLNVYSK